MQTYELMPVDGRKSFYSKAFVMVSEDGTETLYSYGTAIIKRTKNGKLLKIWNGWSLTTGRHIKAFCDLNKEQYQMLEEEKKDEKNI